MNVGNSTNNLKNVSLDSKHLHSKDPQNQLASKITNGEIRLKTSQPIVAEVMKNEDGNIGSCSTHARRHTALKSVSVAA